MCGERFTVREEIQFRCYFTLADPMDLDVAEALYAEWKRRVKARFGAAEHGHITMTRPDPVRVLGVRRPVEFAVSGLVAPLDSTLP